MSHKSPDYFGSMIQGKPELSATIATKYDRIIEQLDLSTIDKKDISVAKILIGIVVGFKTVQEFFVRRPVKALKDTGTYCARPREHCHNCALRCAPDFNERTEEKLYG